MGSTVRAQTSGGKPTGQQSPAPARPQAARTSSAAVSAAQVAGPPAVSLGGAVQADEVDISSGELKIPDKTAEQVKEGKDLDVKVRLPGLAEGSLKLRKRGAAFSTASAQGILLRHPALAKFTAANPTVLALTVKENKVNGFVGLGTPGPVKGSKHSLSAAMSKGADLLNWSGLSGLRFPAFRNQFEGGVIDVGVENLNFTAGGFLSGSGSAALDNKVLSFEGSAKVNIPGGSSGELLIKKDPAGDLSGKLELMVAIGSVAGTVLATLSKGFVSIMGQVGYSGDRLSGKVTLVATDEATARDITLAKPSAGGDVPIELPGPDKPAKPGKRAFCGWGQLTFRVTDWLAGAATVIVNSKGQATIVGEIAPPKEFILFEQKEWIKKIFKVEIRAGYGIPVVGQVGLFANIGLDAIAKVGPGKLYNLKLSGAYSTDPRVAKNLTIEGTINISAFAGLRLRAEAGLVVTILGHDIKAGVGLNAIAGVRGYVEATPKIGMREKAPGGKRDYFIAGHLEIAAQPVLGFSGDLFVAIETPWWSPLSDKRWTWPLFSIEYPLPGEFGIGADVDYVLGSKQWPKIEFGEVNFDSSKFMTDVMNDNTDKGSGGEKKKPGEWGEGLGGKGKGGAKNKGGAGKKPGEMDDDIGPIGEEETFSDGKESHQLWFVQKGTNATLMMASGSPAPVEAQLQKWDATRDMLTDADQKRYDTLVKQARKQLAALDKDADQVALMKEATKKAKQVYEKSKGKSGKKAKGKSGGKELNKLIKTNQRNLKGTITALSVLMYEVNFTLIKESAELWGSGKEAVRTVNREKHAGLEVAGEAKGDKLKRILSGPVGKAKNKAGENLVGVAGVEVGKHSDAIEKAQIRKGRIKYFHVYEKLAKPTELAAKKVGTIRKMKLQKLDRALRIELIPKSWLKFQTLDFPAYPKTPAGADKDTYHKAFITEMDRQLGMQQRGLNRLTVDEWVQNLMLFSMNAESFTKLDLSSRLKLLEDVNARAQKALKRCKDKLDALIKERDDVIKKIATSDKTIAELDAEVQSKTVKFDRLEKAQAEIDLATVKNLGGAAVAPRRDILAPIDPKSVGKKYLQRIPLKILGRMGGEARVKYRLEKFRADLIDVVKDWKLLTEDGDVSKLAVLHNPDQVAGGYDKWPDFPKEPSNWKDAKQVRAYLLKLKRFYGPQVVNKAIGDSWSKLIRETAYGDVTKAVPQEAFGIHRLNLTLRRKP